MPRFCLHLTDEKMIEIGRARDRLLDYKRKIQPYDLEDTPPEPEAQQQIIIHRHSDMSKQEFALLHNLEGQVKYLQGKVTERQERKQVKPSGYQGIK